MFIFIVQFMLAIGTAYVAATKGRNPIGWFFIGCIPYGLGLGIAFLVPPISSQDK